MDREIRILFVHVIKMGLLWMLWVVEMLAEMDMFLSFRAVGDGD